MREKIIVFAPHPDDETFACGGTIVKRLAEGYDVHVVFMTDGRNALLKLFGISSNPTPYELREIRKEEAKRATRILGVREENLCFLDFENGGPIAETDSRKISEILNENSPVEVYFPHEKDADIDHHSTNRIVKNAIGELNLDPVEYRYIVMPVYLRLSPLIEKLRKLRDDFICIDISEAMHLKITAINEYESQIKMVSSKQRKPVIEPSLLRRFLRREEGFFIERPNKKQNRIA